MRKFSLRWVSHALTAGQMAQRVADSRGVLMAMRADAANGFVKIMTVDERSLTTDCSVQVTVDAMAFILQWMQDHPSISECKQ
jgi:hypothetical protein